MLVDQTIETLLIYINNIYTMNPYIVFMSKLLILFLYISLIKIKNNSLPVIRNKI